VSAGRWLWELEARTSIPPLVTLVLLAIALLILGRRMIR
jgi:hypothetical protein